MADRAQPLKLGFIRCGVVTERGYLPALRSLPAAEVVTVADIDRDCLQWVANRFHLYTPLYRVTDQ